MQDQRDWLTNDQGMDPFDADAPMTIEEAIKQLVRHWNIYYKNKRPRRNNDDSYSGGRNVRRRGNGGQTWNINQDQGQRGRGGGGNNNRSGARSSSSSFHGNGNGNTRQQHQQQDRCIVPEHCDSTHPWSECIYNPYCASFRPESAQRYYDTKAKGRGAPRPWYRDIFEPWAARNGINLNNGNNQNKNQGSYFNNNGFNNGQGRGFGRGRGFGGRGRGFGRGRGRGGGRGRGHSYHGPPAEQFSFAPPPQSVQYVAVSQARAADAGTSYHIAAATTQPGTPVPNSVFVPVAGVPQAAGQSAFGDVSSVGGGGISRAAAGPSYLAHSNGNSYASRRPR